jgi:hypothetical protein
MEFAQISFPNRHSGKSILDIYKERRKRYFVAVD